MSQVPAAYSFDAPTDFINFSSLDAEEDTENIDSWFDEKANLEKKLLQPSGIGEPCQGKASLRKAKLQQGCVTPLKAVDNTYYKQTDKENLQKQSIPSNDCCSSLNAKRVILGNTPVQPQRRSVRLSAQKDLEQKEENQDASVEMKAKRCAAPVADYPPNKKMKASHKKKPGEEEEGSAPASSRKDERETLEKAKSKHTVPGVPPAREKVLKSTDKQEMEKRLRMQQDVLEMRRKNEELKMLALAGPGQPVRKSTIQLTKTADFHFLTDEPIKQHPKNQEEYKEVNCMSELQKHPSTPARGTRGCTIIKPFNLSKGKKRTFDEAASAYVPIAQQVEAFHKQTPNRYHLRNKKDQSLLPSKSMNKIA